ncbi:hypothetical protein PHYPSEUDO_010530 [Phytophthora pseudosyringae]|uniref:Uncharacterized protein n=1 Tax=Phytophthora pseudosyringae TaxID=221518 RepID=A0A8T1VAT1_9STRA|nr:hypothetical protein PHYPSEUDO_010530 [Phytophthora pseudosyringae]
MTSVSPRQRFKRSYLATLGEDAEDSVACSLPSEPVDDHHPLVLAVDHASEPWRRSRSESFICTAQGVVFEDAKRAYGAKLSGLVALAANANDLGTRSNVLLAKKTLRYRKAIGRRRILE